ncbi:alpha/beta hydrolase [Rhodospirillaceae bacterium SYSU D60014]|uniref:alpha/beta hydrolase n=1 Tax=Virgifigura deserti TaxID=2268457 RepID=UPI000E6631DC
MRRLIGCRGATAGAALGLLLALVLGACAPRVQPIAVGTPTATPHVTEDRLVMNDGVALPLRRWLPEGEPQAVILALHGFNDYSNAFTKTAAYWAEHGIATYAYDQRGFGATRYVGLWPGEDRLIEDLRTAAALLHARHPDLPLYLLGESMGGAIVMAAATSSAPPDADGIILAAPAVWGRELQGPFQSALLWLTAHTVPWMTLTGEGLEIWPSDNIEMLRALSLDPLVIKETRVDTIYGLVNVMDRALEAAPELDGPALILYGSHEEVVPPEAALAMLRRLPPNPPAEHRIAIYPDGYHMLLRDLQAEVVRHDVLAWIADPEAPLPSGADQVAAAVLASDSDSLALTDDKAVRGKPVAGPPASGTDEGTRQASDGAWWTAR